MMQSLLADRFHMRLGARTGLDGAFDFDFELDKTWNGWDAQSFVLAAVQGIGLKLETGKGPVETIVIDSIEKPAKN